MRKSSNKEGSGQTEPSPASSATKGTPDGATTLRLRVVNKGVEPSKVTLERTREKRHVTVERIDELQALKATINAAEVHGYGVEQHAGMTLITPGYVTYRNNLLNLLHLAFMEHLSIELRPDDIWHVVAQSVATHIDKNSEQLRKQMVDHDGKAEIIVRDDRLVPGSPSNDWSFVLSQFEEGCRRVNSGKTGLVDLMIADFSTSTAEARTASQCVLFKAMSKYVDFDTMTLCGIPSVTLVGSVDDWHKLLEKCQRVQIKGLGPEAWCAAMVEVVEILVGTADALAGDAACELSEEQKLFFRSIYSYNSVSGGPRAADWIDALFAYCNYGGKWVQNKTLRWKSFYGLSPGCFPDSYSVAPMKWEVTGTTIECGMNGGIVGVACDMQSSTLRTVHGWAITSGDHLRRGIMTHMERDEEEEEQEEFEEEEEDEDLDY
eukprot:TRINITY_DN1433_c0_g1_i2.p1 TRINITY_DN1433_c0_g1~~TRINITY_DN1433_c0_g1_i2.p1  ORF type:complete len:434 (+),score=105.68 TRINITY_DN1433_c0_g1_i2:643-1944(+)